MAIKTAPCVLAVKVDYRTGQATIGSEAGSELSKQEILAALETIGYRGEFVEPAEDQGGR
jgi:hypothetical protein